MEGGDDPPYSLLGMTEDVLRYMMRHYGDPLLRRMLSMTCSRMNKRLKSFLLPRSALEVDLLRYGSLGFIQKYATPSARLESCPGHSGAYSDMVIHIAIYRDSVPLIQWAAALPSHRKPPYDNKTCELAAFAGRLEILQWLATTIGATHVSYLCFHFACIHDHLPMVQWLYETVGRRPDAITTVCRVIDRNCVDVFQWLYEKDDGFRHSADHIMLRIAGTDAPNGIKKCWLKLWTETE